MIGEDKKRKKIIKSYGYTYFDKVKRKRVTDKTIYDLASLTKPLATTLAILLLVNENKLALSETLSDIFKSKFADKKGEITIAHLLTHASGFPAHRRYFELLSEIPLYERKKRLHELIINEPLKYSPGEKSIYSDLGFMLLAEIVEKRSDIEFGSFIKEKVFEPMGFTETLFFTPSREVIEKNVFAPTEQCNYRKRVLLGEVSDENCYAMGGVCGHAGLFGTIGAVLNVTTLILDVWKKRVIHTILDADILEGFLKRQEIKGSTWALGFDTPSPENSSAGKFISATSVGHLGFTGTSFWIDPVRDLVIVLLTNRVHPSRDNNQIKEFRPLFHDTIIEQFFG
jgi:CubicO group peptidase (beta-lactamase class C family)